MEGRASPQESLAPPPSGINLGKSPSAPAGSGGPQRARPERRRYKALGKSQEQILREAPAGAKCLMADTGPFPCPLASPAHTLRPGSSSPESASAAASPLPSRPRAPGLLPPPRLASPQRSALGARPGGPVLPMPGAGAGGARLSSPRAPAPPAAAPLPPGPRPATLCQFRPRRGGSDGGGGRGRGAGGGFGEG